MSDFPEVPSNLDSLVDNSTPAVPDIPDAPPSFDDDEEEDQSDFYYILF